MHPSLPPPVFLPRPSAAFLPRNNAASTLGALEVFSEVLPTAALVPPRRSAPPPTIIDLLSSSESAASVSDPQIDLLDLSSAPFSSSEDSIGPISSCEEEVTRKATRSRVHGHASPSEALKISRERRTPTLSRKRQSIVHTPPHVGPVDEEGKISRERRTPTLSRKRQSIVHTPPHVGPVDEEGSSVHENTHAAGEDEAIPPVEEEEAPNPHGEDQSPSDGAGVNYIVIRRELDWEERRYKARNASGHHKKVYVCLFPSCIDDEGAPKTFSRLEYFNHHRVSFHDGSSVVFTSKGETTEDVENYVKSHVRSTKDKGINRIYMKVYRLGVRARINFEAELQMACEEHKQLMAAKKDAYIARHKSEGLAKYKAWQDGTSSELKRSSRRPPRQCMVCRGAFDAATEECTEDVFSPAGNVMEEAIVRLAEESEGGNFKVSEEVIEDLCEKVSSIPSSHMAVGPYEDMASQVFEDLCERVSSLPRSHMADGPSYEAMSSLVASATHDDTTYEPSGSSSTSSWSYYTRSKASHARRNRK